MKPKHQTGHAEGQVNSDVAVKALDHMLSFIKYMPPVAKTGTMDIFKSDELFREGKVALNVDWIGLGEASLDPKTSKVADKLVFGQAPGTRALMASSTAPARSVDSLSFSPPGTRTSSTRKPLAS